MFTLVERCRWVECGVFGVCFSTMKGTKRFWLELSVGGITFVTGVVFGVDPGYRQLALCRSGGLALVLLLNGL